jgi:hypothetical protein
MEEDIQDVINNQLLQKLETRDLEHGAGGKVQRLYNRKQIEQALLETFELVGGIPRLAIWANDPENYGEFLKLLMKLAPKEQVGKMQGQVIEYRSNIGQSRIGQVEHDD